MSIPLPSMLYNLSIVGGWGASLFKNQIIIILPPTHIKENF